MTQSDFEQHLVRVNRAGAAPWFGQRVATGSYLDYCLACSAKAREMQRALKEEAQAGKPKVAIHPGLDVTAIKCYLAKEARMWGIPDDFSDIEWACIKCHKRVNWGASKVVEEPLLKWHLDAIRDPYGRVTAGAVVASLCEKCARAINPIAHAAYVQNQTQGVTT
jgi:hypothetical protein